MRVNMVLFCSAGHRDQRGRIGSVQLDRAGNRIRRTALLQKFFTAPDNRINPDIGFQFSIAVGRHHTAAREVGGRAENGSGLPVMHDAVGLFRRKTQTQQPVPIDRIRIEKKRSDGIRPVLSRPRTGIFRPIRRIEHPIAVHRETPLETGFALPQKQQRDQHQQRNQQQDPPPFAAGAGRANGKIDFADKSVTENTRVSYPIDHIKNIVRPISSAPAAKNVIFLSADAFGVLPPVSILTPEQTQYYFLSGFTAKLAGTERGITEPTPTFSACFGQAFLELHPTKYAEELVKKMQKSGAKAYLVNTGWNGSGKRISIKDTRGIIDAILNGDINNVPTKKIPYFDFEVPTELNGVDTGILDPRDTYADASEWETKAKDLAARFIKNFSKYEGNAAGKALVSAGPQL